MNRAFDSGVWLCSVLAVLVQVGVPACAPSSQGEDDAGPTETPGGTETPVVTATPGEVTTPTPLSCQTDPAHPTAQASDRKAEVRVESLASAPAYLVTDGDNCSPYVVQRVSTGEWLSMENGYSCGCECPAPPAPYPSRMKELSPGETMVYEWDARVLTTFTEYFACPDDCYSETAGVLQPLEPGDYLIRVAMESTLPDYCYDTGSGGMYDCAWNDVTYGSTGPQEICTSSQVLETGFTVPESGDVDIVLTIEDSE